MQAFSRALRQAVSRAVAYVSPVEAILAGSSPRVSSPNPDAILAIGAIVVPDAVSSRCSAMQATREGDLVALRAEETAVEDIALTHTRPRFGVVSASPGVDEPETEHFAPAVSEIAFDRKV